MRLLNRGHTLKNQDEYGIDMESKDGTYRIHMTEATIVFTSRTNSSIEFTFGTNLDKIRNFLSNLPRFDQVQDVRKENKNTMGNVNTTPEETPTPETPAVATAEAPAPAPAPKEKKAKVEKVVKEKKVSARSIMLPMLKEDKSVDEILARLVTQFGPGTEANRDEKGLRSQISLNKSWLAKQSGEPKEKKPRVKKEKPAAPAATAEEPAVEATAETTEAPAPTEASAPVEPASEEPAPAAAE